MILTDAQRPVPSGTGGRATLDDLLRRAAARRPNDIALIDPPNRETFTDGSPRRLTYAQTDRAVAAVAGHLRRIGLHTDDIVGLQMPNTVDGVIALLAVLRAGLIAMPLPILWRRGEIVAALNRVSANALIVSGRIGAYNHFDLAREVAAEIFPVRYVCGFGENAPDGVIPMDDLYTAEKLDPLPALERERVLPPGPGAHLAAITWDVSAEGLVPVARNHAELVTGGLAVLLEGGLRQDAVILTTLTLSSFAGLAVALLPWLLVGGTLALHHPFDAATFAAQRDNVRCDTIVAPGPIVTELAEAGHLARHDDLRNILGVWRAPERLARAPTWRDDSVDLIDVQVFGETGLVVARRGQGGRPAAIPFGPVVAPRGAKGGMVLGEIVSTSRGTVAMRGPMLPRCAFPPGAERTAQPYFKVTASGFADTGYACKIDEGISFMALTGPPAGVVSVGGYRFIMRELQDGIADIASDSTLAALPDALAGHRLAGSAPDCDAIQAMLTAKGANPLVVGAFRERRKPAA